MKIAVFWFRRDLRLDDNTGLIKALASGYPVLPLFIFDEHILDHLNEEDPRVTFIHQQLKTLHQIFEEEEGSGLLVKKGNPLATWKALLSKYDIAEVYYNQDYEPYAQERDHQISGLLDENDIPSFASKDQVIFEKEEVVKKDGKPYAIYTPYKRTWLQHYSSLSFRFEQPTSNYYKHKVTLPSLETIGFKESTIKIPQINKSHIHHYEEIRNFPAIDGGTNLGIYLRFGTVSIRKLVKYVAKENETLLSELIWREFFMQVLYNFPRVQKGNFHKKYDGIEWLNDETNFQRWCEGKTGYPMVDAGMRELNTTGRMHNRVRMVTASFLCKHLLIDWQWGEAYFAEKLLDYELSANNGNWQWAAGTGCDASPYFRVFNPSAQQQKFDKEGTYIKKWIPELNTLEYPQPIVEHSFARLRAIEAYKKGIN